MMLTTLLCASLAAAPTPSLAAPGFTSPNLPTKRVAFITDHLAQQLALQGLKVITASEMAALVDAKRQAELTGCDDASAQCMTELANALGADGIVIGSVALLGKKLHVTVKIVRATSGTQLAFFDDQAENEDALLDLLASAAPSLAASVRDGIAAATSEAKPTELSKPVSQEPLVIQRRWGYPVAIAGAAIFVAGFVTAAFGWVRYQALVSHDSSSVGSDPAGYAQTGSTLQTVGLTVGAVGAAAAIAGAVLISIGHDHVPEVTLVPTRGGALVGFSVSWR
jgi:hypothetical protein